MPNIIFRILAWVTMLAGLTLPPIAPALSNNLMWPLLALGLLTWLSMPERVTILSLRTVWIPLLAGLLLLIASVVVAKSFLNVAAVLIFGHLYFAGGLVALFQKLDRRLFLTTVGLFALIGAAGGTIVVAFDVLVLGSERGGLVNNPVRMAELILPLSFVALVGVWGTSRAHRWFFLLGPIIGIAGVYFTGSRGPLLASLPMLAVAFSSLCFTGLSRRRALQVQLLACAIAATATIILVATPPLHALPIVDDVVAALGWGGLVDGSTAERLTMYEAAYRAFLASPWIGHGLIDYVKTASLYALPGQKFHIYDHLHSDIANFAVAAGVLGVAAYFVFLSAPIAGALRVVGAGRQPMLYLATVTSVGYASLGITDTTIGVHWQNIVFATVLAIVGTFEHCSKKAYS